MIDKTELILHFIDENLREVPENLNNYIGDETGKYKQRFELDDIKKFIDEFINQNSRKRLIVLPGIRGVGKTTLLYQTYEYLLKQKNISPSQILYTSCDDLNDITECSIRELTEIYLEEYHNTTIRTLNKKIFLLIDEAQYDKNWGLSSKILYDKSKNIFILITGSSALELKVSADVERRSTTHEILPLTYPHYLKLKYNIQIENNDELMINTFLTGNIDELKEKELQIKDTLINNINYTSMDWKNYLYYGGFPEYFDEEDYKNISNNLVKMTKKVVKEDITNIKNISEDNKTNANRVLRYLALLDSADISINKLSNYLNTAIGNIDLILNLLEDTHLIFHIDAYGTPSLRTRKPKKYYFATSSIKYALSNTLGNNIRERKKFEGVLIENMVASKLFEKTRKYDYLTLFYDSNKNGNVDFIIKEEFGRIIPIEVGRGKKDNKQIKKAIHDYKADYGIIISDTTRHVEKIDDIIYVPIKTFALL